MTGSTGAGLDAGNGWQIGTGVGLGIGRTPGCGTAGDRGMVLKWPADYILPYFIMRVCVLFFATAAGCSPAMSEANGIRKTDLEAPFLEALTSCSFSGRERIERSKGIKPRGTVVDGLLGAISKVRTSHGIESVVQDRLDLGVRFFFRSDLELCATYVFLRDAVPEGSIELESAFMEGKFSISASASERRAFNDLFETCEGMGESARLKIDGGDLVIIGGEITTLEDAFSCDAAVFYNTSSTRVSIGAARLRITIVGDKVFFVEE